MTTFDKWNWTTILSILVAVELQIGSGQMSLAHMFPADWIPFIIAWSSNLGSIGATVMAVISYGNKRVPGDAIAIRGVSTSLTDLKTGDHVSIDNGTFAGSGTAKIVGTILIAFMLVSFAKPASAQLLAKPRASTSFLDTIRKWISADNQAAIDLATAVPELQDPIGATCWKTFKGLGDIVEKHPLPVTLKLASDIEAARLIQMAIKKVCAEPACNQVWNDMQNQVAALAPISTPFTLASICAKVL